MPRGKKHTAEEIIGKLREAEILLSQGSTQEEAARQLGVAYQTYCRWRMEYGGMKRLLADAELDKAILKEAASGNF